MRATLDYYKSLIEDKNLSPLEKATFGYDIIKSFVYNEVKEDENKSISRNIHVHVPIVADAKEAVAKMREYVEPCETKEWLERIAQWNAEHPLTMKVHGSIGPRDIIEEMNRQFDDAIITTDVGQHQMFVTQYAEITEKKQLVTPLRSERR